MMNGSTQFVSARDGTQIAYRSRGEGRALVFVNGYTTSEFYWIPMMERHLPEARYITWDLKGHGDSGPARDLAQCTIQDSVDDMRRVMDAAGIEKATILGFSLGCQVTFEAWRQMPDRIEALVPILGTYGQPYDHVVHPLVGRSIYKALSALGPRVGDILLKAGYIGTKLPFTHTANRLSGLFDRKLSRKDMKPFYDHFAKIDGRTWVSIGLAAQGHSAADLFDTIDIPVLIIAGGRDVFTPAHLSQQMERLIPGATLVTIPEATHAGLLEVPDKIGPAITSFLHKNNLV
jgi:pimeloyl-ACP methyl ester carboxylesterase